MSESLQFSGCPSPWQAPKCELSPLKNLLLEPRGSWNEGERTAFCNHQAGGRAVKGRAWGAQREGSSQSRGTCKTRDAEGI